MTKHLMEAICSPENIAAAVRAVVRNKGAAGVDGMTVRDLPRAFAEVHLLLRFGPVATTAAATFEDLGALVFSDHALDLKKQIVLC
jgi:hypothetical protein